MLVFGNSDNSFTYFNGVYCSAVEDDEDDFVFFFFSLRLATETTTTTIKMSVLDDDHDGSRQRVCAMSLQSYSRIARENGNLEEFGPGSLRSSIFLQNRDGSQLDKIVIF